MITIRKTPARVSAAFEAAKIKGDWVNRGRYLKFTTPEGSALKWYRRSLCVRCSNRKFEKEVTAAVGEYDPHFNEPFSKIDLFIAEPWPYLSKIDNQTKLIVTFYNELAKGRPTFPVQASLVQYLKESTIQLARGRVMTDYMLEHEVIDMVRWRGDAYGGEINCSLNLIRLAMKMDRDRSAGRRLTPVGLVLTMMSLFHEDRCPLYLAPAKDGGQLLKEDGKYFKQQGKLELRLVDDLPGKDGAKRWPRDVGLGKSDHETKAEAA